MNWRGPAAARFADGRLHLQHGPIDLIIEAWGAPEEIESAYRQAEGRFADILEVLVRELAQLRTPLADPCPALAGPVAQRMLAACWPYRERYITPMAAVAGAVADEMLASMLRGRMLAKAYVNNGGDIALHLSGASTLTLGVVNEVDNPALDATAVLDAAMPVRGLATSGWRGRSQSLGIADAVTVFAADAAAADAAATMIANAVDAEHPAIARAPARALRADSDLGDLPVTVAVGPLPPGVRDAALERGLAFASAMQRRGLIQAAYLALQGKVRVTPAVGTNLVQGSAGTARG